MASKLILSTGSRQSGELFRAKLQGLEKAIQKATGQNKNNDIEFIYPTAPFEIETPTTTSDLRGKHGAWTWFQTESIDGVYPGLNSALDSVASTLKSSGPFNGVIGFSQGAALAAIVASLLEPNRKDAFTALEGGEGIQYPSTFNSLEHSPLKFAIIISGYTALDPSYRPFYEPGIRTPTLHILGSMDNVVDEEHSRRLVESCHVADGKQPVVIRHFGGHVIPAGKKELAFVAQFVKSNVD